MQTKRKYNINCCKPKEETTQRPDCINQNALLRSRVAGSCGYIISFE